MANFQAVDNSGSLALEDISGVANSALDIWARWSAAKIENVKAKNEIPSTVVPNQREPAAGFNLDAKTIGIGILVLLLGAGLVVSLRN